MMANRNIHCPTCEDIVLVVADRDGIEVDYCPECRGVWLDRGELDKIVARSRAEDDESRRPPESIERHREQRQEHLASQRRDSTRLAEKLFDF